MKISALALIALVVFPQVADPCSLDTISKIVKSLEELSQSYVNVTTAVKPLDELLKACSRGDFEKAVRVYSNVSSEVEKLYTLKESSKIQVLLHKALTTLALVLIPVAVYMLLPRIYLYLWYTSRRRWAVVKKK
ncbi:MAG: hypothetical protein LM583_02840 [Desulfurococcaceae archaeon]|nr:hypothetical protein [Desulfurococcaceae archaeon]